MALQQQGRPVARLPPDVSRILYVKNLPFEISAEEMYDVFGKFGPIRQIRVGDKPNTKGTGYVVYMDIMNAQTALKSLQGFNLLGRYLVVLFHKPQKAFARLDRQKKQEEIDELKKRHNITTDDQK